MCLFWVVVSGDWYFLGGGEWCWGFLWVVVDGGGLWLVVAWLIITNMCL